MHSAAECIQAECNQGRMHSAAECNPGRMQSRPNAICKNMIYNPLKQLVNRGGVGVGVFPAALIIYIKPIQVCKDVKILANAVMS